MIIDPYGSLPPDRRVKVAAVIPPEIHMKFRSFCCMHGELQAYLNYIVKQTIEQIETNEQFRNFVRDLPAFVAASKDGNGNGGRGTPATPNPDKDGAIERVEAAGTGRAGGEKVLNRPTSNAKGRHKRPAGVK